MAHMDTVPLCVGSKPVVKGKFVQSAKPHTGLGADDRAGFAVVLSAALRFCASGCRIRRSCSFGRCRRRSACTVPGMRTWRCSGSRSWPSTGTAARREKLTIGATGALPHSEITIHGIASHAGGAPEQGVSAITIAGLAIADLSRNGWLGDVRRGHRSRHQQYRHNSGGAATNVVTDRVEIKAEARSHDPTFRRQIREAIEQAFRNAAGEVRNITGAGKRRH